MIKLISFGAKYGNQPAGLTRPAMSLLGVENPYNDPKLKDMDGTHPEVQNFLRNYPIFNRVLDRYSKEAQDGDVLGFYCNSGKHRSVAMVEILSKRLAAKGYQVSTMHRDIDKG